MLVNRELDWESEHELDFRFCYLWHENSQFTLWTSVSRTHVLIFYCCSNKLSVFKKYSQFCGSAVQGGMTRFSACLIKPKSRCQHATFFLELKILFQAHFCYWRSSFLCSCGFEALLAVRQGHLQLLEFAHIPSPMATSISKQKWCLSLDLNLFTFLFWHQPEKFPASKDSCD